jgi:hypothetical protein
VSTDLFTSATSDIRIADFQVLKALSAIVGLELFTLIFVGS